MSTTASDKEKCRTLTPEFRASFPHLFKAQAMPGTNNAPKYSITMLFPKDTDMKGILAVIREAKTAKWGPNKDSWPKTIKSPIQDGDGEAGFSNKTQQPLEGYAGHWIIKASTGEDQRPGVVDENVKPILDAAKFYPGCYARAYVYAYVWEFPKGSGKWGVGFILDHVQKLRDGKSFGGKKAAGDVFQPVNAGMTMEDEIESEDFL